MKLFEGKGERIYFILLLYFEIWKAKHMISKWWILESNMALDKYHVCMPHLILEWLSHYTKCQLTQSLSWTLFSSPKLLNPHYNTHFLKTNNHHQYPKLLKTKIIKISPNNEILYVFSKYLWNIVKNLTLISFKSENERTSGEDEKVRWGRVTIYWREWEAFRLDLTMIFEIWNGLRKVQKTLKIQRKYKVYTSQGRWL